MNMREYRLKRLATEVAGIAAIDSMLAEVFARTLEFAKEMYRLDYEQEDHRLRRNHIIELVAKTEDRTETLLQKRRKIVEKLLKAVEETHAKDLKELKEALGLLAS